jgi:hypothetical protein
LSEKPDENYGEVVVAVNKFDILALFMRVVACWKSELAV